MQHRKGEPIPARWLFRTIKTEIMELIDIAFCFLAVLTGWIVTLTCIIHELDKKITKLENKNNQQ